MNTINDIMVSLEKRNKAIEDVYKVLYNQRYVKSGSYANKHNGEFAMSEKNFMLMLGVRNNIIDKERAVRYLELLEIMGYIGIKGVNDNGFPSRFVLLKDFNRFIKEKCGIKERIDSSIESVSKMLERGRKKMKEISEERINSAKKWGLKLREIKILLDLDDVQKEIPDSYFKRYNTTLCAKYGLKSGQVSNAIQKLGNMGCLEIKKGEFMEKGVPNLYKMNYTDETNEMIAEFRKLLKTVPEEEFIENNF